MRHPSVRWMASDDGRFLDSVLCCYLSNVDFAGVHEFEDGGEMLEWDVLEDDDRVLGRVLLQQSLDGYKRDDRIAEPVGG